MRIGILTFHRALNYGAFLQAYALSSFLKQLGHDVEFIDYWPIGHQKYYQYSFSGKFIVKLKKILFFLLTCYKNGIRFTKAQKLQRKYLNVPKRIKYNTIDSSDEFQYDVIIYGSDQIWWKSTICGYEGFDSVYWGEGFEHIRKVSYAPSMGIINLNDNDKDFIKQHLSNFSHISVRENLLKTTLLTLGCLNVKEVVDPTFLMGKEWWNKHCKPIRHPKHYIMLFNLCRSQITKDAAILLSKKTGLAIIEVTGSVSPLFFVNSVQTADAFEFLTMIRDADYIITSSFHATAFSIIFEKQFYCVGFGGNSNRAKNLLNILNLSNRYLAEIDFQELSDIDYTRVSIANYVDDSKAYLLNSLI